MKKIIAILLVCALTIGALAGCSKSGNSGKSVKNCSASELKCAAFVRTHTNSLKGQEVSSREMMSVSALEQITGVTYFPNVPNAPKDSYNASDWGL